MMPQSLRIFRVAGAAAVCALMASCASVSVRDTRRVHGNPPAARPERIFVKPLTFEEGRIRADRSGEALEQFQQDVGDRFAEALAERLNRHVAPAEAVSAGAKLPRGNYWVIDGHVTRLEQGSRLLRAVVGMGFGGTKLETTTTLSTLEKRSPAPFYRIETTGGSNVSPGTLGAAGYFVNGITALFSLVNTVEGVRTGVSFDAQRAAKEVAAATSEFLYEEGAIPREAASAPKRLGRWSPDVWPFRRLPARRTEGRITVEPAS